MEMPLSSSVRARANAALVSLLENGTALPYPFPGLSTTHSFHGGDTVDNLTGVLHWP
jgi:hypothetical protein